MFSLSRLDMRSVTIFAAIFSVGRSEDVGAAGMDGFYNGQNDELIEFSGDSWNDHDGHDDETSTTLVPMEEFLDLNGTSIPNSNVIYTCGGTAEGQQLSYCQFPFTTLAGNEYTNKCADQAEDNPDVSVDRPWCFVSATDWGFCDCTPSIDFTYLVAMDSVNKTIGNIVVQVSLDYPGTVWCYLEPTGSKTNVQLAHIQNGTVTGGSTTISAAMILQSMVATLSFNASIHSMQTNPVLACSANCTGMVLQPDPMKIVLGSRPEDDEEEDPDPESTKPRLLTHTSGALVYSILILMLLGFIVGARYALNMRERLMYAILSESDGQDASVQYGLPLRITTK